MGLKDELSGLNHELSMFPVRAFEFQNAGTVIIEQDVADVGSVVWDAEVMLAHHLDRAYGAKLRGKQVLELGGGTGVAGLVAARLGASVVLTDQAKLLPTLVKNARANAPDLEKQRDDVRSLGVPTHQCQGEAEISRQKRTSQALTNDKSWDKQYTFTNHASAERSLMDLRNQPRGNYDGANASAEFIDDEGAMDAGHPRRYGDHLSGDGSHRGSWRVAELLFSESSDQVREAAGERQGFDLVMGADIIYLRDLWNAIACTFKVLTKDEGECLISFEQRRGDVSGFFRAPYFASSDGWGAGKDVDLNLLTGAEVAQSASDSRVRVMRMSRLRECSVDGV